MTILSVDLFLIDLGMNFIPCDSLEIHAPKIRLWYAPERQLVHRPENPHMENPVVVKAHLSAALSADPRSRLAALSARQRRHRKNARYC